MKINFGSGKNRKEGYVNVDLFNDDAVDIVHDLNHPPYPFKDNSADIIYAKAVCEHIQNMDIFMSECWRILKPKGTLVVIVPYYNAPVAFEIDHKIFFKLGWYKIFLSKDRKNKGSLQAHNKTMWQFKSQTLHFTKVGKILSYIIGEKGVIIASLYIGNLIFTFETTLQPHKTIVSPYQV